MMGMCFIPDKNVIIVGTDSWLAEAKMLDENGVDDVVLEATHHFGSRFKNDEFVNKCVSFWFALVCSNLDYFLLKLT